MKMPSLLPEIWSILSCCAYLYILHKNKIRTKSDTISRYIEELNNVLLIGDVRRNLVPWVSPHSMICVTMHVWRAGEVHSQSPPDAPLVDAVAALLQLLESSWQKSYMPCAARSQAPPTCSPWPTPSTWQNRWHQRSFRLQSELKNSEVHRKSMRFATNLNHRVYEIFEARSHLYIFWCHFVREDCDEYSTNSFDLFH